MTLLEICVSFIKSFIFYIIVFSILGVAVTGMIYATLNNQRVLMLSMVIDLFKPQLQGFSGSSSMTNIEMRQITIREKSWPTTRASFMIDICEVSLDYMYDETQEPFSQFPFKTPFFDIEFTYEDYPGHSTDLTVPLFFSTMDQAISLYRQLPTDGISSTEFAHTTVGSADLSNTSKLANGADLSPNMVSAQVLCSYETTEGGSSQPILCAVQNADTFYISNGTGECVASFESLYPQIYVEQIQNWEGSAVLASEASFVMGLVLFVVFVCIIRR
eukprot:gnl/Dysnectes_brevis/5358_a7668_588.p1 GENE.gnl/Dysnectes_brevis/5358_a7668_588~~gnl/Dysnectes_brevis/5358_a7668_588.p1  ORF type:complete len:296 (+),score=12.06 gnl/Dysnectes_brevis/5358_a7668_588:68-889(+)